MPEKKGLIGSRETALLRFGAFELDLAQERLRRSGRNVRIRTQPFRLLALLASRAGDLVLREEIQEELWPGDTFVDFDQGINHCIRQIRAALHDDSDAPTYVETVPRRGYRLIAPVERVSASREAAPATENPPHAASPSPAPARGPAGREARRWWAWAAAAGLVTAIFAIVVSVTARGSGAGDAAPPRPVLAVLPFEDLGSEAEASPAGDAMTEELITQLGRRYAGRIGVIARTSSMSFKGRGATVEQVGDALGADYVLEGSVRRSGRKIRFAAQLIRVADQSHLWASTYDRSVEDFFQVQSEVSDRIAEALALKLLPAEARQWPAGATDPQAFDLYVKARRLFAEPRPDAMKESLAAFQAATQADPGFAQAWAGMATAWRKQGASPREKLPQARVAAERALALDDRIVEAWLALAWVRFYLDLDLEGAREAWTRALEINPASAEAHHDFAAWFSVQGRHDEAIASVQRALALDPLHPMVVSDVGWYYYFARRPGEAIRWSRRTLEQDPDFYWAHRCILRAAIQLGDAAVAAQEAEWEMRRYGGAEDAAAARAAARPDDRLRDFWAWSLRRLEGLKVDQGVTVPELGIAQLLLGDARAATESLEVAYDQRSGWILPFLNVDPIVDPLRGDPRFEGLLVRISAGASSPS